MSHFRGRRFTILVVAALWAVGTIALAETCTMELKRVGTGPGIAGTPWFTSTSSQGVSMQFGSNAYRRPDADKEFRDIVKKEPEKYVSKEPFKGVVKFGSGKFAFVLDAKDEKSKGYDRLYFDINGNGDLTDDKPIDAVTTPGLQMGGPENYANHSFPRVDLTIPVDGKTMEYSFTVNVYSYGGSGVNAFRYASASFRAAAYRQGEITIDGKKHQVVLLDNNGNGRFDDEIKIPGNIRYSGGGIYAEMGDMVVLDPDQPARPPATPWAARAGDERRQYVSKLAKIGEKYYDVKVSATGDELTLTPSTLKLGFITNPNGPYTGMIYGDHGFLPIRGEPGKPVAVPEGQWKLLSCNIEITGWKPPPKPPKEAEKKDAQQNGAGAKKASTKGLLESITKALLGSSSMPSSSEPRYGPAGTCSVDAHGTEKCLAVTVRPGETVTLPFGPPYKPVVEAFIARGVVSGTMGGGLAKLVPASDSVEAQLSMSLVGSGGESVSNLVVDGLRPTKPEFTITDPKGEVVQKGSFEYG
jgi:hypothetical protein